MRDEENIATSQAEFLTNFHHELRTPLTKILSSAELLKDYGETWSEEKRLKYLQYIQDGALDISNKLDGDQLIAEGS
ncbi:MAG: histidine kinase dimerization/phospho-acceptor domain-containing protein [Spirulinaceae cyanobacterium]